MHGIYFDGCDSGIDCQCCGDRWHKVRGEGTTEPLLHGNPLGMQRPRSDAFMPTGWMHPKPETVVHFVDGSRKWFWADNTPAPEPT